MSARPASTYRSAKRNLFRALKVLNLWHTLPYTRAHDGALWKTIELQSTKKEKEIVL